PGGRRHVEGRRRQPGLADRGRIDVTALKKYAPAPVCVNPARDPVRSPPRRRSAARRGDGRVSAAVGEGRTAGGRGGGPTPSLRPHLASQGERAAELP